MNNAIIVDTEAILAELRKGAGPVPDDVREFMFRYYPEFAMLRKTDRLVEIIRERFGYEISKSRMQGIIAHGRKP